MNDPVYDAGRKLLHILDHDPVNWNEFDVFLQQLEDINYLDEKDGETILSDFVTDIEDGQTLLEVIRHFLACGYDVTAHEGKNGILVLCSLCWSSYDRYVLDAAKLLLDAGAPTLCEAGEDTSSDADDYEEGNYDVLETIGWKVSGEWNVHREYEFANILEAYYQLIEAARAKKNYTSIDCYLDCLGQTLTAVSVPKEESAFRQGEVFTEFSESLIFWFENKPLVISPYQDFIIDPLYVEDNRSQLKDATPVFSALIGAKLKNIQYAAGFLCFLDFDNGMRILFIRRNAPKGTILSAYEIRPAESDIPLEPIVPDQIFGWWGYNYPDTTTTYKERSLAFFREQKAFVLYPDYMLISDEESFSYLRLLPCSPEILDVYTRLFPVGTLMTPVCFYESQKPVALRFTCGNSYLYIKESCTEIAVALSDSLFDPSDCYLEYKHPKPIHFTTRKPN